MFALTSIDGVNGKRLWCKVADARFLELTDQPGIVPAPYLARAHWICITEPQRFTTAQLQAFIHDAYVLVRSRLTKKMRAALGPLPVIEATLVKATLIDPRLSWSATESGDFTRCV